MDTLTVEYSFWGRVRAFAPLTLVAFLLLAAMIAARFAVGNDDFDLLRIATYFGIVVAAAVLFVIVALALASARRTGVAVQFTPQGIIHTRVGWPLIEWGQISRLETHRIGLRFCGLFLSTSHMLIIHPKTTLPAPIRTAADGSTSFAINGLKPSSRVILEWLERHQPTLLHELESAA